MWIRKPLAYAIMLGFLPLVQNADIRLYKGNTVNDYKQVPLINGTSLLNADSYDFEKENVFYIFGYNETPRSTSTETVLKAVLSREMYNVFLVNWEKEAASVDIGEQLNPLIEAFFYPIRVLSGSCVAAEFGKTLASMADSGLDLSATFLVGHSLGAHVAAEAGLDLKYKFRKLVQSVIGLDPAGPIYDQVSPGLATDCAVFTNTIMTDPGGYGSNKTQAHVNILVNCKFFYIETDKEKQVQPACPIGTFPLFSSRDLCSHWFSWRLFAESFYSPGSLQAAQAANCRDWEAGNGTTSDIVQIGLDIDQTKRGIYCLSTNSAPPYGKGAAGLSP